MNYGCYDTGDYMKYSCYKSAAETVGPTCQAVKYFFISFKGKRGSHRNNKQIKG